MTKAEVEAIFGEPVEDLEQSKPIGSPYPVCSVSAVNIRNAAEVASKTASVSVPYGPTTAKKGVPVQKWFQNAKVGVEGVEPVAGVGDEAFCAESMVFARRADVVIATAARDCSMAKQLAEKAIARL